MRLSIVAVGRDRHDPLLLAAAEYIERVRRYFPIDLIEVREEPAKAKTPPDRVRQVEAERLKEAVAAGGLMVALDQRGTELGSEDLARRLSSWAGQGKSAISFLIGGPLGLDPALQSAAQERWSLSKLTLPHRLARLVLAEQLYRGCTIIRGEPYHK